METVDLASETPVRCASFMREQGADPIGSMGTNRSYLLVEWPLPWPADLGEIPALAELRSDLKAADCRLQGVVAPGDAAERRIVRYASPAEGPFTRFTRREVSVPPADVVPAARRMLQAPPAPGPAEGAPDGVTDLLVCTHGRRDRCCGSFGTALALSLIADPDALGARVRVLRTSHTGGHRYAPTAILFPDGTGWAFADEDLLRRVVRREGPVSEVLPHYRGCVALGSPRLQAVERAVLAEVGWSLFDSPRWGEESADGTISFAVELPVGTARWRATVEKGRVLPVPECGSPLGDARKTNTELVISAIERTA